MSKRRRMIRQIGSTARQVVPQLLMPDWMPNDLGEQLIAHAQAMWEVRGAMLPRLMFTVFALIGRGLPPMQALQMGAHQLNLPPRSIAPTQRGLSAVQVRQFHRRQEQRGRRPGQSPQMRGRLQREAEFEWMLGNAAEAMARPLIPIRPKKFQFSPTRRSNMIAIVGRLDRDPNPNRSLSSTERHALLANLLQILNNNVPMVMSSAASFQSLQSMVNRPRWRFLRQFPNARNRFLNALRMVEQRWGRQFQIPWL